MKYKDCTCKEWEILMLGNNPQEFKLEKCLWCGKNLIRKGGVWDWICTLISIKISRKNGYS